MSELLPNKNIGEHDMKFHLLYHASPICVGRNGRNGEIRREKASTENAQCCCRWMQAAHINHNNHQCGENVIGVTSPHPPIVDPHVAWGGTQDSHETYPPSHTSVQEAKSRSHDCTFRTFPKKRVESFNMYKVRWQYICTMSPALPKKIAEKGKPRRGNSTCGFRPTPPVEPQRYSRRYVVRRSPFLDHACCHGMEEAAGWSCGTAMHERAGMRIGDPAALESCWWVSTELSMLRENRVDVCWFSIFSRNCGNVPLHYISTHDTTRPLLHRVFLQVSNSRFRSWMLILRSMMITVLKSMYVLEVYFPGQWLI